MVVKPKNKICNKCNKNFTTIQYGDIKYCSRECYYNSKIRKTIECVCQFCKKEYKATHKNLKLTFCSKDCYHNSKKTRIEKNCKICNNKFLPKSNKPNIYCSNECRYTDKSTKNIKFICTGCEKEFERNINILAKSKTHFCNKTCKNTYDRNKRYQNYKRFKHPLNLKTALKYWSYQIKERDSFICQGCGENNIKFLEAHHIKHKSKYPELAFNIDNGITLCFKCHLKEHVGNKQICSLIQYKINKNYV